MGKLSISKRLVWILLAGFILVDIALLLSVLFATPRSLSSTLLPTAEYLEQNPAPTPEFISTYSIQAASGFDLERSMFVTINEEPFARQGISADEITGHIFDNHNIYVDGSSVKTETISL